MCLDGLWSGESGDYASVLSDRRELRLGKVAVLIFRVVSGQLCLGGCESTDIISLLFLVLIPGLLVATPLLVGNFPGTFVALRELAVVLGSDRQELRTILSFVSIFVSVVATTTKYELTHRPESTG